MSLKITIFKYCYLYPVFMMLPSKEFKIRSATPQIEVDYFKTEELEEILQALQKPWTDHRDNLEARKRYFLLLKFMFRTGARISEILNLRYCDVDLQSNSIKMITLKRKKSKKQIFRYPPLHSDLKDTFMQYLLDKRIQSSSEEKIFKMKRTVVNAYLKRLENYLRSQGSNIEIRPHKFRHSFAVYAILAGTPLNILQKWLGHSSAWTTSIYTEITGNQTQAFMERIP